MTVYWPPGYYDSENIIKMRDCDKLAALYDRLLDAYGPQNWWPAESAFEVIVGAVLTQNTSWKNVEKAITGLKMPINSGWIILSHCLSMNWPG